MIDDEPPVVPNEAKIDWVKELAKVELKPGDIVVLMTERKLSFDQAANIRRKWNEGFHDIRCVVLDDGMRLGVLSPVKSDAEGADVG